MLVLYPKLGEAVYFDSLLSFSDLSETLKPFFQYINCYYKLHNIEKKLENLSSYSDALTRKQYRLRCPSLFKCIQSFDASGCHRRKPFIRQEENLAIRYWIAYMCMSNNSSSSRNHSTTDHSIIQTASIDYTVFHQDTKLEFVDVKNCLGNFSYDNEWEALLITKLFKGIKTKYISEDEESEDVFFFDDTDVELPYEADEATISKSYQTFFDSWIMNKLKEWNFTLSSSTSFTYRL